MPEPLVSIVIPCYNASGTIRKALRSIQLCGYTNYEVLLVNDGSTDETGEVIEKCAAQDKRIAVFHQGNSGVSVARNLGVRHASANFIAFLDADDIFFKGCITERVKIFMEEDSNELVGVFCPAYLLGEDLVPLQETPLFNYMLPGNRLYFSSVAGSAFNPSSVIVKKEKFVKAGGFCPDFCPAEDFELWHRMMRFGGYFQKAPNCCVGWVQHPTSTTHSNHIHHYRQYREVIDRLFTTTTSPQAKSEYRGGLGDCYYRETISSRAMSSAISSAILGRQDDALAISKDITGSYLAKMNPEELLQIVKFNAIKTLCKPESLWPCSLWDLIRPNIAAFFASLTQRYNGASYMLTEVISRLDVLCRGPQPDGVPRPVKLAGGAATKDTIEILSVELLKEHRNVAESIYRKSRELQVGLGWHYILDLIWILREIQSLPRRSIILDAGAGNGLLQFLLADMGYRVISVDFADRPVPPACSTRYPVIRIDSGEIYDNDYIRHLQREFYSHRSAKGPLVVEGLGFNDLLPKIPEGTLIYYRSDIADMKWIRDGAIDAVVSLSALEHNPAEQIKKALRELQRVLKPGRLMLATVSAAEREDWYHGQSKGWCFTESTLRDLFSLKLPRSNFAEYARLFGELQDCKELQERLDPSYFRSGNNGMPWGVWQPRYQPVGIRKINLQPAEPIRAAYSPVVVQGTAPETPDSKLHPALEGTKIRAFIDTTNACNLRCIFCTRGNSKLEFMDTDRFSRILDRIAPVVNYLQLCCAWEYSIAPNAHEIVAALGSRRIAATTIYTNGQILPDRLARGIVEAQINQMVFSVGETRKETYERIRKRGKFERLLQHIAKMKRLKEGMSSALPKLCANLTLINSNIEELVDFIDLAQSLGITEVRGRHLILNDGLDMDSEIIQDKKRANAIIETAGQKAARSGMAFNIPRYIDTRSSKQCTAPWMQLYVSSNGDVSVCPRIHIYANIGNLNERDLRSVLTSSALTDLQKQMQSGDFKNPVCGICQENRETERYIRQGF